MILGLAPISQPMAVTAETLDPVLEEQLTSARERVRRDLTGREALGRVLFTCVFLIGATTLAVLGHSHHHPRWWMYAAFGIAYALVSSIRLEVGSGLALPTELVLVTLLFLYYGLPSVGMRLDAFTVAPWPLAMIPAAMYAAVAFRVIRYC